MERVPRLGGEGGGANRVKVDFQPPRSHTSDCKVDSAVYGGVDVVSWGLVFGSQVQALV